MNKIKIVALSIIVLASACTKNLTSLNEDPKNPDNVPSYTLFTNAQRSVARTVTSSNVNLNIFRLIVQHWQETTYTDESNYDLNTRNIPQGVWTALYRDGLQDLNAAKKLIQSDVTNAAVRRNELAITDIMQVYTYYYLVTTYGDIPYSDALNIDNVFPKFDKQDVVYNDLLTRIDTCIAALNTTAESFGTADILFGGDVAAWKRFAASLKLKMGMTIADANVAKAKTTVESAVQAGVFTSNEDNATFDFLSAPPNTNPIWEDLVQSGRKDFVGASTLIDRMKAAGDPRLPRYFTLDAASGYSGGKPGASSSYTTFSKPAVAITAPNFPGLLIDYAEVEFLLAEAVERGFTVGGTAASHYNAAITASITYWGGTQVQATTYLAMPAVNYVTAAGTYKQKIGNQKWIALYNRGWDAWIEWRRLDAPALSPAVDALTDIPLRFTYPVNEQNYNTANYNSAAASIGGDDVTTKLFWDKF